jgi:cephalosporin hydroxylase
MKYLEQIRQYMNKDTDISSHLDTIYIKTLEFNPKNIVELGVREGESSRVFSCVNDDIGSSVVGVDVTDCEYSFVKNGTFYKADDTVFHTFYENKYGKNIDLLFIDTSHLYDHTVQEIKYWFPLLSQKAMIIFHDTNLNNVYLRKNGSVGAGWDNQRGVIRAIEEVFGVKFNEHIDFQYSCKLSDVNWKVVHEPLCNGLTILYKN